MKLPIRHIVRKRAKAQALHYAILVCALVGIMLGAMVMSQANHALGESHLRMGHLTQTAAFDNLLHEVSPSDYPVDVTNGRAIETDIRTTPWGAYDIIISEANSTGHHAVRTAMVGSAQKEERLAVWLSDKGDALAVAGDTRIVGPCHLPKRGVKRAYIAGKPFSGHKLLDGKVKNSGRGLPALSPSALAPPALSIYDSIQDISDLGPGDGVSRSFSLAPMLWEERGPISLHDITLEGHVIVSSKDSIYVSADTHLENVLLMAPVVHFASGFEGSAQVFASQAVTMEEGSTLLYPSSLIVYESATKDRAASIHIGQDALIIGAVIVTSGHPDFRNPVHVDLDQNCLVGGTVYTNGYVQHKGRVWGSIYTPEFRLKTAASSYTNHLLDAEIDITKLPEQVILPRIFKDESGSGDKKIISWLN